MDNCFLEVLSLKPAKLNPPFKQSVTEYTATVASDIIDVKLDCLPVDNGASYSVLVSTHD